MSSVKVSLAHSVEVGLRPGPVPGAPGMLAGGDAGEVCGSAGGVPCVPTVGLPSRQHACGALQTCVSSSPELRSLGAWPRSLHLSSSSISHPFILVKKPVRCRVLGRSRGCILEIASAGTVTKGFCLCSVTTQQGSGGQMGWAPGKARILCSASTSLTERRVFAGDRNAGGEVGSAPWHFPAAAK